MAGTAYKLLHGPPPPAADPHRLVLEHLWLPPARCRALGVRGAAWDDAVQEGSEALMKPARRFDPKRGVPFANYALPYVDGAIKTMLCRMGPTHEPVKRVRRRISLGGRAHPDQTWRVEEVADAIAELDVAEALDRRRDIDRGMAWVSERLSAFEAETGVSGDMLESVMMATIGLEVPVREFARQAGVPRETLRTRVNAGLEYLRAEAIGEEIPR